jgi:WD40 repeat protein
MEQRPLVVTRPGYPTAMAWSSTGDLLAVGDDSGELALYSPDGERRCVRAHEGPLQSLAWHPRRAALLTTGQDGAVRSWEAPFTAPTELLPPTGTWADHACWSPKGEYAAVALGTRAHVFGASGAVVTDAVASTVAGLAFSPSGKSLGMACYGGATLVAPATGKPLRKLAWRGSMVSIVFSPDGSVVACGCQDNSVHFWRVASGQDSQMSGYPAKPRSISFNHDGSWLATSGDATISLWPFDKKGPEGRRPVQLEGHTDVVTEVAFAPLVDVLISGSRDGVVAVWMPPKLTQPVWSMRGAGKISRVAWGADSTRGTLRWAMADAQGQLVLGEI